MNGQVLGDGRNGHAGKPRHARPQRAQQHDLYRSVSERFEPISVVVAWPHDDDQQTAYCIQAWRTRVSRSLCGIDRLAVAWREYQRLCPDLSALAANDRPDKRGTEKRLGIVAANNSRRWPFFACRAVQRLADAQ